MAVCTAGIRSSIAVLLIASGCTRSAQPVVSRGSPVAAGRSPGGPTAAPVSPSVQVDRFAWRAELRSAIHSVLVAPDGTIVAVPRAGRIEAFAARCGRGAAECRPLWTTSNGRFWNATLHGGRLYATSERGVQAFPFPCRSASGWCRPLWIDAPGPLRKHVWHRKPWLVPPTLFTQPVVEAGVVYVGATTLETAHPGENLGRIYAYPTRCGSANGCRPLWTSPLLFGAADAGPIVVDGVVYAATSSGLFAFPEGCRLDGGVCRPLWSGRANVVGNSSMVMNPPAIVDGTVYVTTSGDAGGGDARLAMVFAYAIACRTDGGICTPLWRARVGRNRFVSEPVPVDGTLLISTERTAGFAYARSCASDGGRCRPDRVLDAPGRWFRTPVVAGGDVVISSWHDGVFGFSASCGEVCLPVWTSRLVSILGPPIPAGRSVYVAAGRAVYAIAAGGRGTVAPSWSWEGPKRVRNVVVTGRLVIVSAGRSLFAIRAPRVT